MEKTMQFKTKAQLAALKAEETSEQTIVGHDLNDQPSPTLIPLPVKGDEPPKEDSFISFEVPDYPKSLYDEAVIANEMRDFNVQLGNAMRPVIKEYTPPPVPAAVAAATLREMEAGRQRVAEFASVEQERRAIIAARPKEPWESRTTQVFRPAAYVPDPRGVDRTGTLRTIER